MAKAKGRRGLIRQKLERSCNNIDHYLVYIHDCIQVANSDNLPLERSLEELALYAVKLQKHTYDLRDAL